ncbi:MAG: FAD-dependent oxidoreductase [Lachnospiraceae bacterium]|nr:FAD-dependent oxidoreductase [Lachnospiraceae bacterium]
MEERIYDTIIIGGGPAGLSAAIYAQRAELDYVLIEKAYVSGGQIINTSEVDNYPGLYHINGFELGNKFYEHAKALGAEIVVGEVSSIDPGNGIGENVYEEDNLGVTITLSEEERQDVNGNMIKKVILSDGRVYNTRTIIWAAGATHSKLGLAEESNYVGRGVSYCATCDGAFFKGKEVAVVGGGDVALVDALFLSRMCSKVYLIHRRDEFRGAKSLVTSLRNLPNVEFLTPCEVTGIFGDEGVEGITVVNKSTGDESIVIVSGLFVCVGMKPETKILEGIVKLDEKGYIVAGENTRTSVKGIFAAGDVRTKELRQVLTAAADGAIAATKVAEMLY